MEFQRTYGVARFVFALEAVIAFLLIVGGCLAAVGAGVAANNASKYLGSTAWLIAATPGLGIALGGIVLWGQAQWATALLDNADMMRELLSRTPKRSAASEPTVIYEPRIP